jgi:hypothetical protein
MQQPEPFSTSHPGAGIQLQAPPRLRLQNTSTQSAGDLRRSIPAAAIYHQNLWWIIAKRDWRHQQTEQTFDRLRVIEYRNDDAEPGVRHERSFSAITT